LLTDFHGISVQQAFQLCTILSAFSFALAASKLLYLSSVRQYRPFVGLLIIWFSFCVVSLTVPVSSKIYLRIYLFAAPVSWLLYLFVCRDLYQGIFSKFRGIAFAGRWCLYLSGALLLFVGIGSVLISPGRSNDYEWFKAVYFVDRSVLFGLAFFLVLLVSVIVRYPISIQKNLVVHTLVFSGILFAQSVCQVADQGTGYLYSVFWNTLAAGTDTVLVTAWAILINKAGESLNIRIRHNIKPETEIHLLHQLDSLNGILLRAARK
jgi:hypothetical protein